MHTDDDTAEPDGDDMTILVEGSTAIAGEFSPFAATGAMLRNGSRPPRPDQGRERAPLHRTAHHPAQRHAPRHGGHLVSAHSITDAPSWVEARFEDDSSTFHNGTIGRLNAWFFDAFDRYINVISRPHKRHAFADIAVGTVLEIGAGVGANFGYLPADARLLAVEPNEAMHRRLIRRARERDIDVDIIGAPAERLPIPDDSVDTVICSLVLCTVPDPAGAVAEIRRVLRPGGTFRFVEHVAARPISPRRWIQAAVARPWSWLFEGCRLCSDTGALIDAAGFAEVDVRSRRLRRSVFFPVNSVIFGRAVKSDDEPSARSAHRTVMS